MADDQDTQPTQDFSQDDTQADTSAPQQPAVPIEKFPNPDNIDTANLEQEMKTATEEVTKKASATTTEPSQQEASTVPSVETPPVEEPPVETPPAEKPAVGEPLVDAPPTAEPESEPTPEETSVETQSSAEPVLEETPATSTTPETSQDSQDEMPDTTAKKAAEAGIPVGGEAPKVDAFKMTGGVDSAPVVDSAAEAQVQGETSATTVEEAPPTLKETLETEDGIPAPTIDSISGGIDKANLETSSGKGKNNMVIIGSILIGVALLVVASAYYLFLYLPAQKQAPELEPQEVEKPVEEEPVVEETQIDLNTDPYVSNFEKANQEDNLDKLQKELEAIDFDGIDTEFQESEVE